MGSLLRTLVIAAAVLPLAPVRPAQAREPSTTVLQARDLFSLRRASDAQVAPDGSRVAYVRHEADIGIDGERRSVVVIDVATRRERVVASGASTPRWAPDGRRLAFVEDGGAISLAEVAGGRVRRLTPEGVGPASLSWSPDGATIAFTRFVEEKAARYVPPVEAPTGARWAAPPRIVDTLPFRSDGESGYRHGHRQLFVLDVGNGSIRQLTEGDADVDGTPAWLPDGRGLVFSSMRGDSLRRTYMTAQLYRVGLLGGTLVHLPTGRLGAREPTVSPDGRSIAFIGTREGDRNYMPGGIYLIDAGGGEPRQLAPHLDREPEQPRFAADGRSVLASYGDGGRQTLGRFDLRGSRAVIARDVTDGFSVSLAGRVAFVSGATVGPGDVAVASNGAVATMLSDLNGGVLRRRRLGSLRPLEVRSSLDGAAVGTWLLLPPDHDPRRRYPTIVAVHGGPYGFDAPVWRSEDQLLAAAGYVVLRANYRGSTSYGYAFADRIARDYPSPSFADIMSAVDAAVAAGVADERRLFITGGSAGGEITAWAVGSTDRFKAAVAVKPVINQVSQALTSDQFAASALAIGGPPWDRPEAYWKQSALSRVGRVRTPTMLIVGEQDHRTPVSEAAQFYTALKVRRVPTLLALVPDAGHDSVTSRPSRLIATTSLTLDWFARYGGPSVSAAIADEPSRNGPG